MGCLNDGLMNEGKAGRMRNGIPSLMRVMMLSTGAINPGNIVVNLMHVIVVSAMVVR